jgi:hypothetical protein
MQEIAGCSPETRISFMETASGWAEIDTDSPETAGNRAETTSRSRESTAATPSIGSNVRGTKELHGFRLL